jgi:hypothetical protein
MKTALFLILQFTFLITNAQKTIYLCNLSFEGFPQEEVLPNCWESAATKENAQPDTQPSGQFEIYNQPFHGNTYLSMVTQSDGTVESIGQELSSPLLPKTCYLFGVYLARSVTYKAFSPITDEVVSFKNPVQLEIWGGHPDLRKRELLGKTEAIVNTNWLEYQFKIEPKHEWDYIELRANFLDDAEDNYFGNVLLDYASHLSPMGCQEAAGELEYAKISTKPVVKEEDFDAKLIALNEAYQEQLRLESFYNIIEGRASLSESFEKLKFVAFSDKLTTEANESVLNIAQYMSFSRSKLVFVLVKGEDEMSENRIGTLTKSLLEAGMNNNQFSIKQVKASDLQRKWFSKNMYWWVRFDKRRK